MSIPSIKVDMLQLGKYLNIQGKELWKNLTLDHRLLRQGIEKQENDLLGATHLPFYFYMNNPDTLAHISIISINEISTCNYYKMSHACVS